MRNWGQKNAYQYFTFVIGCYPCLYCLVFHENMVKPLSAKGHAPPRTYESICTDHQRYIASRVSRKQVQHFYNCIMEPIFNIPIEQVNMHFVFFLLHNYTYMHTHTYVCTYTPTKHTCTRFAPRGYTSRWASLQSFMACLKMSELALLSSEEAHSSFDTYSQELQMLRLLQLELKQAEEAYAVLQQMITYVSLVIGEKDPVTADFFVQCEEKKKHLGKLVSHMH